MSIANSALAENAKTVVALSHTAPSGTTPAYVSMKNYGRCTIIIAGRNTTTVTGSAITLAQATAIAGTNEKALALSSYWANANTAASDALVNTAATSNTFTTSSTNSINFVYQIEVKASDLDTTNSFDCVRVATANTVNSTLTVVYILRDPRFADASPPTAVTD